MNSIKKLELIIRISVVLIILPFAIAMFKTYPLYTTLILFFSFTLILIKIIFLKKKKDHSQKYKDINFYYLYGSLFLILGVIFSVGTMESIIKGHFPIFGLLITLGSFCIGFLLIYYTFKSKKEIKKRIKKYRKELIKGRESFKTIKRMKEIMRKLK